MKGLFKKGIKPVLLGGLLLGTASAQLQDVESLIKYRKQVMKSQAAHLGAIAAIVKGRVPFKEDVAVHAAAIHSTSRMIPKLFPKGSGKGNTRAKPKIWEKWDEFEQAAKKLEEESARLVRAAEGGDMKQITARFTAVTKACKGCHVPFRKPKR